MDTQHDLPTLERVQIRDWALPAVAIWHIIKILAIPSSILILRSYARGKMMILPEDLPLLYIGCSLIAALTGWVFYRALWCDCVWKTDELGLTARSLVRERGIHWSEVKRAATMHVPGGDTIYRLETGRGIFAFSRSRLCRGKQDAGHLAASIRQHLRRYGKSEGIELSPRAQSFWTPLPEDLPESVSWKNPRPPKVWLMWLSTTAMALAMPALFGWMWLNRSPNDSLSPIVLLLLACLSAGIVVFGSIPDRRRYLSVVRGCTVDMKGIAAETCRGQLCWSWADIEYAHWRKRNGASPEELVLGSKEHGEIAMPY